MRDNLPAILVWFICTVFSYGALLANIQSIYSSKGEAQAACRRQAGVVLFFAMIPIVGPVLAIFGTGFIEHGFQWTCQKDNR